MLASSTDGGLSWSEPVRPRSHYWQVGACPVTGHSLRVDQSGVRASGLVDRIRAPRGVIDLLELRLGWGEPLIFNLADLGLLVGVAGLVWHWLRGWRFQSG